MSVILSTKKGPSCRRRAVAMANMSILMRFFFSSSTEVEAPTYSTNNSKGCVTQRVNFTDFFLLPLPAAEALLLLLPSFTLISLASPSSSSSWLTWGKEASLKEKKWFYFRVKWAFKRYFSYCKESS